MVRELQRKGDLKEHGVSLSCNPDFNMIARAYGLEARTIAHKEEIEEAIEEALRSEKPYFLEFIVSDKESTL